MLEWRFPVLLEEFAIREGSGGDGRYRGGDGVRRRIRFLAPMTAAVLSGRRTVPPFGLNCGKPGKPGINSVIRKSGETEILAGCAETDVQPGDAIQIETPGGGGFGEPDGGE